MQKVCRRDVGNWSKRAGGHGRLKGDIGFCFVSKHVPNIGNNAVTPQAHQYSLFWSTLLGFIHHHILMVGWMDGSNNALYIYIYIVGESGAHWAAFLTFGHHLIISSHK